MKKLVLFAILALSLVVSCSKFDDSAIWDKLNNHETRIAYLEEVCKKMNGDIVNLQTIVTALESNDCVTGVTQLATGDGYAIAFKSGKSIVIYNGKDGQNGSNGKDAVTPVISVMKDDDGLYYWTVNGEWLIVDGQKVKASAVDGKNGSNGTNGTNGEDGVTPKFKIENDYWYISYDNGKNWEELGKAKGDDGLAGENGDSLFKRVFVEDGYVCFEMNDESSTVIRLPLMKDGELTVTLDERGTLSTILNSEETRTTTYLTLKGKVGIDDLRHIQIMTNLHKLDLGEAEFTEGRLVLNPYQDTLINKTLAEVIFPKFTELDFSYCLALEKVTITTDKVQIRAGLGNITFCPNIRILEYAEGVTNASTGTYWKTKSTVEKIIYPSTTKYIPATITSLAIQGESGSSGNTYTSNYMIQQKVVICKALTPPVLDTSAYSTSVKIYYDSTNKYYYTVSQNSYGYGSSKSITNVDVQDGAILYVPKESLELYRTAPLWENFTNIQAIPDGE